jgi:hypothetical protein
MKVSVEGMGGVYAAVARYILITTLSGPMPLFDGAIQFLGGTADASMKS